MRDETVYQHSLAATVQDVANRGARTLLVTSSEPGEGKSSVAADLGRALAMRSRESVLVVDADQYKPTLHEMFDLPSGRGLGELLDEVYQFDLLAEEPAQFGLGDWFELLRAQHRTGELQVVENGNRGTIRWLKGRICSISDDRSPETRLGELLVRAGQLSNEHRAHALRVQEDAGRPLGEVLQSLEFVTPEQLTDGLQDQTRQRLVRLIGWRQPECRFAELADGYLPAACGRSWDTPASDGVDGIVRGSVRTLLRDPYLSNRVTAYVSDTRQPNLKVLTGGSRGCDLLAERYAEAFQLLLQRFARVYDIVLIDAPPVSLTTPTSALAARVDGVLMVIKADGTEVRSIRRAVEELRRAGGKVLGVVLNQIDDMSVRGFPAYYQVMTSAG